MSLSNRIRKGLRTLTAAGVLAISLGSSPEAKAQAPRDEVAALDLPGFNGTEYARKNFSLDNYPNWIRLPNYSSGNRSYDGRDTEEKRMEYNNKYLLKLDADLDEVIAEGSGVMNVFSGKRFTSRNTEIAWRNQREEVISQCVEMVNSKLIESGDRVGQQRFARMVAQDIDKPSFQRSVALLALLTDNVELPPTIERLRKDAANYARVAISPQFASLLRAGNLAQGDLGNVDVDGMNFETPEEAAGREVVPQRAGRRGGNATQQELGERSEPAQVAPKIISVTPDNPKETEAALLKAKAAYVKFAQSVGQNEAALMPEVYRDAQKVILLTDPSVKIELKPMQALVLCLFKGDGFKDGIWEQMNPEEQKNMANYAVKFAEATGSKKMAKSFNDRAAVLVGNNLSGF